VVLGFLLPALLHLPITYKINRYPQWCRYIKLESDEFPVQAMKADSHEQESKDFYQAGPDATLSLLSSSCLKALLLSLALLLGYIFGISS